MPLYEIPDPKPWIEQGFKMASISYANMDKGYKRVREESPPEHSGWGAVSNAFGGGFMGYQLGHLLGEAGLSLLPLLGGATQTPAAMTEPPLIGEHWGLSSAGWGAILGAGLGLLSYLFS